MENIAANRALAARYARALFEVALAQSDPRAIERDLAAFTALFDQQPALRKLLWSPAVPVPRKVAVIAEIVSRGQYPSPLEKMITLMAERDHLAVLPRMGDSYRRRVMDHYGIVEAEVTTATPLSPERVGRLGQALAQATGKQVQMSARVDPAIIGGVVAKVDSTVYDGSVVRQLERIKAKLAEGA